MSDTGRDFARFGFQCLCKRRDTFKLRRYLNSENKLIGLFCTECNTENLTREYLVGSDVDVDEESSRERIQMLPRPTPNLSENRAFQVQSSKTKIDQKYFADILKPGDQISWHRKYCLWHHAIVEEVVAEKNELILIHWNIKNRLIKILRSCFKVEASEEGLFNKMYRIDYPVEITKTNDPELVLARARSRINDTGYSPFTDNCESFATYCKTGVEKSHQLTWFKGKLNEYIGQNVVTSARSTFNGTCKFVQNTVSVAKKVTGKVVPAESIGYAVKGINLVATGIVIILEAGFVIWDLKNAYGEREKGNISRNDFIETAIRRVVDGIVSAGVVVSSFLGPGSLGITLVSPFGPVGIIIGGVLGGVLGGEALKLIGTYLGCFVGKAISASFKSDDRTVTNILDLQYGDHIVVFDWILHPRCHAIVVEHNGSDNIKVIRNKYKAGIVEEWIPFSTPLFKVEYLNGTCKEPEKVVKMARSKLGQSRYCLATYNCKTFARQCKLIKY
ncbi:uncharacterized protein LOC132550717 [Ylistrum balloti]|uniref:uncharacterized protein LOC132550717 n=1 Tax=Ylistrum balloti TaxID=509963 RepID=UPI002905909F|nr:uncharacterized protein LOC132550717 [Ylistrum balloti]